MTVTKRGARARAEIMDAARGLLVERGLEGFTLREVARMADYSPAALYNHFRSKDALVEVIAMEALHSLGRYMQAVPEGLSPTERLRGLCAAYLDFARDEPERYGLVFDTLESSLPWDQYLVEAWPFTLLVDAMADGLASGDLSDVRGVGSGGLAYGLWALCHGLVSLHHRHLARVPGDFDPLRRAAVDAYIAGITIGR